MNRDLRKQSITDTIITGRNKDITKTITTTFFSATVSKMPEFSIAKWEPVPLVNKDDGLSENECWPKDIAPLDPGFVLLSVDPYYAGKKPPYDYAAPYVKGVNGA
jgi:hypothetical protein